jgi:hypothetical protein
VLDLNMHHYHHLQHKLRTSSERKLFNHRFKTAKRTGRINIDRRSWVT